MANSKMTSKKIGVIIPVSKEFLRYTIADFFTQMRSSIAEAFAIKFDQAALFGINSPFGKGVSVFEKIQKSGNTIALNSLGNLYDELNGLMALVEDADKDVNGFTTTRRFRQNFAAQRMVTVFRSSTMRQAAPHSRLLLPIGYVDSKSWDYEKRHYLQLIGITLVSVSLRVWNTKSPRMRH